MLLDCLGTRSSTNSPHWLATPEIGTAAAAAAAAAS